MAAIDYNAITEEIAEALSSSSDLAGVTVTVDDDINLDSFGVFVNVELTKRDPSTPGQSLSGGQRQRYIVTAVLSVVSVALDRRQAIKDRNEILAKAEIVMMRNRTLDGKVSTLFLQGGELFLLRNSSATSEGFFVAAGEIILGIDVEATTV